MAAPESIGPLMNQDDLVTVLSWITSKSTRNFKQPLKIELLYSLASGKSPGTFHACTDNKGPLLTVLKAGNVIVGCYCDLDGGYCGTGQYNNGTGSFIFRLRNNSGAIDRFLPTLNSSSKITYCSGSYGPTHGGGHDFYVNDNMGKISCSQSTFNDPTGCILGEGRKSGENFPLQILETYQVTEVRIESDPWFAFDPAESEIKKLKASLLRLEKNFSCPANIVLFGGAGAGKSSFINSVDSVFSDYVSQIALSGRGTGSLTRVFTKYEVPSLEKVNFYDTMGWDDSTGEYQEHVIEMILDGNICHGMSLNQKLKITSPGLNMIPKLDDQMHAVVAVLPSTEASGPAIENIRRLWQQLISDKDRQHLRMVVLLTFPDKFDSLIAENIQNINISTRLKTLREKVSEKTGVPESNIFPIWNYMSEYQTDLSKNTLILMALRRILEAALMFFRSVKKIPPVKSHE